jgi:hypothetical protein
MDPVRHLRALVATWRGRFILAFVVVQMLAPLTYYIARRDKHDERFAWRMFSPMRMTQCRPQFTLSGEPVDLNAKFHEAWIEIAGRGRLMVLDAMAAKLCGDNPGKRVDFTMDCQYIDRPAAHFERTDVCR